MKSTRRFLKSLLFLAVLGMVNGANHEKTEHIEASIERLLDNKGSMADRAELRNDLSLILNCKTKVSKKDAVSILTGLLDKRKWKIGISAHVNYTIVSIERSKDADGKVMLVVNYREDTVSEVGVTYVRY